VPPSLQGPTGTFNTPRIQITNFDTTKAGFVQLDYNHAFNAAGSHLLKGGWGCGHSSNDVDVSYPGGYVYLYWGQSFPARHRPDRAPAPTATTPCTISRRAATSTPTSRTCSSRTAGRSAHG
jgi:hypothetical protein